MGPAIGAAESEEPLQELRVDGNGHLETAGEPEPRRNCKKSQTGPVVVALIVVSSALIAAVIALAVLAPKLSSADLCPACPDGWMGYRGKCYYFSETEGNWTYSQSRCSALGASLAGIDSEQEMTFLLRHKDIHDHWIGLRREPGLPWKWTNGTELNHLFVIRGGGDCAYLNDKWVISSRCSMERRWICSQLRSAAPTNAGRVNGARFSLVPNTVRLGLAGLVLCMLGLIVGEAVYKPAGCPSHHLEGSQEPRDELETLD